MAATDLVTEQQIADLWAAIAARIEVFLVLSAAAPIPEGTPANTIIFRTAG